MVACQIQKNSKALQVGDLFYLICPKAEGQSYQDWNPSLMELRLSPEDQYKVKLIHPESVSADEIKLLVTSYLVGQHEIKNLQVVDAVHSEVLQIPAFQVTSVIDPQKPPPEPFGPVGPLGLRLSGVYWWSLLGGLIFLAVVGIAIWKDWRRRRDFRQEILKLPKASFASREFSKNQKFLLMDLRRSLFQKKNEETLKILLEIQNNFHLFLGRIGAFKKRPKNSSQALAWIESQFGKTEPQEVLKLKVFYKEFEIIVQSLKQSQKTALGDFEKLAAWLASSVEVFYRRFKA